MGRLPQWMRNRDESEQLDRNAIFRGLAEYDAERARELLERLRQADDPSVAPFEEILERVEAKTAAQLERVERRSPDGVTNG